MPTRKPRHLAIYLPHHLPIWRLPEGYLEKIRRRARTTFDLEVPLTEEAFTRALPEAEVLFAWGLARRHVEAAKRLAWLHTPLAGVDRVLNPELLKSPIRVTSSRGVNSVAVAEHVLALILALTRGVADAVRAQSEGRWVQEPIYGRQPPLEELQGKLLGILGLGDIGRELAVRARAFGMTVWGLTRTARPKPDCVDRLLTAGKEDRLFRNADILVVALPLTSATQGLIGERQLKRMKTTALLVNIGRGALVQESALVRALREGWIAGAGLDVFATEPLPAASPLWTMPHVVLTPHVAGTHPEYMARAARLFLRNLKRYLGSDPLLNEVDKKTGY
ncbi:MAG TPA: D-2-hydroxyacid dehydrogenase [Candidatus Polarisedimenticolia bacterium]|nr:D-2-hydroxyacid dehydrogenase [Candidatus Polarisedimenticolia bacterium]